MDECCKGVSIPPAGSIQTRLNVSLSFSVSGLAAFFKKHLNSLWPPIFIIVITATTTGASPKPMVSFIRRFYGRHTFFPPVCQIWDAGTRGVWKRISHVFTSSNMFLSTGLLFLRLADDFDYCSVICTAFAAFYVWNTFLGVRVRVERARVKGPVNALCRCYVCVKHLLLIGFVSALYVAHPHHQF